MSFLSVEPQSKRYLAFFQERRRIEATYIDSLRKLHRKAKTIDSFDPRDEPTTTRAAWDTVRDDLRRGMHSHTLNFGLWLTGAFVDILDNDVIKPLRTLKGTAAKYADYAENTISKLQRAYLQKYYPQQLSDDGYRRAVGRLHTLRLIRTDYAGHVENKISKPQQAYLKKYLKKYFPRECARSIDDLRCPQDIPTNKRVRDKVQALFRGRRENVRETKPAKLAKSDSIADVPLILTSFTELTL
ncbi:hypothetical protein EDB85DRAFT_2067758 [Lactarius pseudohatsudake]|nr:hypothetical protein EDB85DRAFT_2067758 [Lactarius pseudohatsudake]